MKQYILKRFIKFLLLIISLLGGKIAFAQTVSFANLTGGLAASISSGQSKVPVLGFSTTVSGGTVIFSQFNLAGSTTTTNFIANGTLYRSSGNSYNAASPGTPVGNVVFSGTNITISNLAESVSGTNYYFMVVDAINTSANYFQFTVDYNSTFAVSNTGTNYQAQFGIYQGYNFGAGTPYALTVVNQTGQVTSNATAITPGTNDIRFFQYSVKNNSAAAITISAFNINSDVTLSSYLNNFRLYASSTTTIPGTATATGAISGTYVGFTGLSETIAAGATKYFWLVADCPNGTSPTNVQFNFKSGQGTNAIVSSAGNFNTFTAYGNTYNIATASITMSSAQNGLGASPLAGGETKAVFGFGVTVAGNTTLSAININSNNASLSTYVGNAKLYSNTSNSYTTGTPTLVSSGTISGSYVNFTGLSESISNTTKYYFLVVDGVYSGNTASSVAFNFTSGQSTNALVQTGPAANYNTFNVTGTSYTLPATTTTVNYISGGVTAGGALLYGQGRVALYGLSIQSTGLTTMSALRITDASGNTTGNFFTNGKLYSCTTNNYTTGTLTEIGTVSFSGTNTIVTGLTESIANTTKYYFLALEDKFYGTTGNFQPVLSQITNSSGTNTSYNIYGNYYSFNTPAVPTVASITGGLTSNAGSLVRPQNDLVLFGFSLTANAQLTFSQFSINSNLAVGSYFTNFKLYRNTTNTYGTGMPTLVGTATASGNYVNITSLTEAFTSSSQTNYYFLVADYSTAGTLPATLQFNFTSGQSTAAFTTTLPSARSYNTYSVTGNSYSLNTASISMSSAQNGLASTTVYAGQTNLAVFGFGITVAGSSTISAVNINSNNGNLSTYIGNAKLYSCPTSTYASGSATLIGSGTVNGSYVNFTGLSETIANATKYYFLVVDDIYTGTGSSTVAFNFANAQSTNALVQTSPASTYNNFTVTGTTFNLNPTTVAISGLTTGLSGADLTYGETGKAVFGFSATVTGFTTLATINIKSNNANLSTYFTGKLYRSTVNSYTAGSATLTQVGTVTFNGSDVVVSGLSDTLTNGQTNYYFLAVDVIYYTSAAPQVQFNTTNAQSPAFLISAHGQSFNGAGIYTNTYTLRRPAPTITVTGINNASNGITQGSLSYGQTNIVLFGFKLDVLGVVTINQINLASNIASNPYFTNGKLYRSTTPYFSNATLVNGASLTFNNPTVITLTESFTTYTAPTTYYYFVVADLNAQTYMTAGTFQYNFGGANAFIQSNPYIAYSGTTTNGKAFSIVTAVKWVGGTSSSWSDASNFRDLQNNTTTVGANTVVEIGVSAYTNAPVISANANIGGITFGTVQTPTLTINSGVTVTVNNGISAINGVTGTISGASGAVINLTSAAQSGVSGGSTLVLTGGVTVNNAGSFIVSANSKLDITGNSTLANTGTLTLSSDANGSASIGALANAAGVTKGTVTGTVNVERYITGGSSTYRGYRLLSSPVHSGSTTYYDLGYLKGSGTYLTGTGGTANGWDVAGNPTLYLYRPDITPNPLSFTNGNYRPVTKINNTPNAYLTGTQDGNFNLGIGNGYLMFYRGNNGTLTTTVPSSLVLSASGTLNQGDVQVKPWFTGAATLDYTATASNTNSAVRGFNLVGNPYPSTIDWNTNGTNANSGIYRTNVGTTIYVLDPVTQGYSTYNSSNGSSTLNGSRYIPSGQGFFVLATSAAAQLTFREVAKVSNQVSGTSLLLNTAANTEPDRHIRMQLYKADNIYDDIFLGFKQGASTAYVFNEDSPYKQGNGKVSFSSFSSDREAMAINYNPLPEKQQVIPLKFTPNGAGLYKLNTTEILNVPEMFDVWLYDNLTKDSLDIRHNKTYSFKTTTDTASYGANRFKIVIRANAAKGVRLLNFSAVKNNSKINVSWTSENEADHTQYILERSLDGGKTFVVIDSLISAKLGTYNDIDPHPAKGLNQYRLKQTDVLGKVTYSAVVPVMYTELADTKLANNIINLYPNPVSQTLNLAIAKADKTVAAGSYKITIVNSLGRIVQSIDTKTPSWQGNVGQLLPGTYFVQVLNTVDNTVTGKSTFIKL